MSPSYLFIVFIALCAFTHVLGDLYMQNPRGNNDRLNEDGDRDNANRLFDSQNNAAGGYCWGPELTYYEGSQLSVQWTNQHSCGVDNTDCNIVIQYMCTSDSADADVTQIIRDGVTTNTIPTGTNPAQTATYYNAKTGNAYTYGMNEDIANYQSCIARDRNKGLFVADQNVVNNQGSMATRQNPTGTVYGFECTEENDYYPYWHPAPWKDIAVLANDASAENCAFYQNNSENVVGRYYCASTTAGKYMAANNEADCATANGVWTQAASHNLPAPDCLPAPVTRDNHLGNSLTADTANYNWTLPFAEQEDCIDNGNCTCVLRMRYNITLGELTGDEDSTVSGAAKSPVTGDPNVQVGTGSAAETYTLALDTAQTGRTFQDRSFMFRIAPRPDTIPNNVTIHNLNVRGKRGNIVQTYPATEYDFTPNALVVNQGDQIDIQWTGCDTNPAANAGEGTDSTDRSNIVQLADKSLNYPANVDAMNVSQQLFQDPAQRKYFANIGQTGCLTQAQLAKAAAATKNAVAVDQNTGNCALLNAAKTPLFTGGLLDTSGLTPGATYPYMSTRNNNFSNRSQKATIIVNGGGSSDPLIGSVTKAQSGAIAAGIVVAVAVGALAGTVVYAKRNPHSRAADFVGKIPGLNKI